MFTVFRLNEPLAPKKPPATLTVPLWVMVLAVIVTVPPL
jgi:hypothetical protein